MNFGHLHFQTNLAAQSERGLKCCNFFVFHPILMKFGINLLRVGGTRARFREALLEKNVVRLIDNMRNDYWIQ